MQLNSCEVGVSSCDICQIESKLNTTECLLLTCLAEFLCSIWVYRPFKASVAAAKFFVHNASFFIMDAATTKVEEAMVNSQNFDGQAELQQL